MSMRGCFVVRFVEIVEELARQGLLHTLGIVPLMCASATTPYAVDLITRLRAAAPSAVVHTLFLGPSQLAQVGSPGLQASFVVVVGASHSLMQAQLHSDRVNAMWHMTQAAFVGKQRFADIGA